MFISFSVSIFGFLTRKMAHTPKDIHLRFHESNIEIIDIFIAKIGNL